MFHDDMTSTEVNGTAHSVSHHPSSLLQKREPVVGSFSDIAQRVLAFIPAHNEQELLPDAIRSILTQTVSATSICVISDNSTDRTMEIANSWGSRVHSIETVGNRHMKAGALNQVLSHLQDDDETVVLVMDADSRITPSFIESALSALASPKVGAVGGIFVGDGQNGLLGAVQGLEYVRYAREIGRSRAKARVLTGTATVTRLGVLREVGAARTAGRLPGHGIYNYDALTEDFCLTLAIKSLGYLCVSPKECLVVTETMADIPSLWRQRVRWQRGAIQALHSYGVSRITIPYAVRQIETGVGILALTVLWTLTIWSLLVGQFAFHPAWLCIGAIFQLERIVSGWRADRKGRAIAATMLGDMAYDVFISLVYVWVWIQSLFRTRMVWGNITIDAALQKESH
jgi:cellulose synthase/poly-beta-1,6-N-acetylglucosamine synthase-like glycosyltransferase